ncbi:arrestin domain-containing protein 3 isoform X2 [Haplochromis burtoni]|uniref:arrestin domain-containing protein 3 isoform X2 n=1 Tax=Haplochromis burtoni TaxID=8153 RepID=UPI0003BD6E8F|nr:arrestin domain-containing protein 3 isoform X2 [Haplochromis burtoni]
MFEQTIRNFKINFIRHDGRNSFSSGDQIIGHISFDLTKETKITSITMRLKGNVNVHWTAGGGGGKQETRKRYSARLDFFDLKGVILQEDRGMLLLVLFGRSDTWQTNSHRLCPFLIATRGTKLQLGTHVYPFTCQLPLGNFPSSFHGVHGKIAYTLTVGINRPWRMSKDFVTELKFVNHIDTNQPGLNAPLSGSNSVTPCSLWCNSSPVTLTVSVATKAFTPGETVKIFCEFSNPSSKTATPKVKLQQKQTFYTHSKRNRKVAIKTLACVSGEPVGAQVSYVRTEIMLAIPSSASLTISECSILVVDYIIEVKLHVGALDEVVVLFPIILCDTPVQTYPPV